METSVSHSAPWGRPLGFGIALVSAHAALWLLGPFSAAPALVVGNLYLLGQEEASATSYGLFITALLGYPAVALSTDRLVVANATALFVLVLTIQAVYVLAFLAGTARRRAYRSALAVLQRRARRFKKREALAHRLAADPPREVVRGLQPHQQVGSFVLGKRLACGAMGEVYLASHAVSGELAAVKVVRSEFASDPVHRARFAREARVCSLLNSPHVVRLVDTRLSPPFPFIAMEWLRGPTLAELLRGADPLSIHDLVTLCEHVASGIDAAAEAGVVHRDIKPENLILATEPDGESRWKLVDFGTASVADEETLTHGAVVGTPQYMAPEQVRGRCVDSQADLYSLAAVLYHCVTGIVTNTAPTTPALLFAVVSEMPIRPSALASVHHDVDLWAATALAKSAASRFSTGRELAAAFRQALNGDLAVRHRRHGEALIAEFGWQSARTDARAK